MLEAKVHELFERYERLFNRSLAGSVDDQELASLYASAFIAATPAGVMTGQNDEQLVRVMSSGYAYYRSIGTRGMSVRAVRLSMIDEYHCVAHVGWRAAYARDGQPDVTIDFEVHYLVQALQGEPKVFGWVSGDEQELLRQHGIG